MTARELSVLAELRRPGALTPTLRRALIELLAQGPVESTEITLAGMDAETFMAWVDEDTHAEWVEGRVVVMAPASEQHQNIVGFLAAVLRVYVEVHGLGKVLTAPFPMKLARSVREPDLLFVAQAHLERLRDTYLEGPADLVVEVISPEGVGRDRGEKFYEYEEAGIPEYWLIDPERKRAEFYRLGEDDRYHTVLEGAEGRYESKALPGFWLEVPWLWSPPSVLQVLQALALV